MRINSLTFAVVLLCSSAANAASVTTVNWASINSGDLNGADVTLTGLTGTTAVGNLFLSFPPGQFDAAPLGSTPLVQFGADSDWTATFDDAQPDLLLYIYSWRGSFIFGGTEPPVTYVFSKPFTILSGLDGSTHAGNVLTLPADPGDHLYYGIVQFDGLTGALSVDSDAPGSSGQAITFGLFVPDPIPGDGNGDGWVDGSDYLLWAGVYGTHPGTDGDISDGDYNDDGWVDGLDYLLWAGNFGNHSATNIPEPTTLALALAALGIMGVGCCRSRRLSAR